ncbi:uncharacterized protein LOC116013045 [Ipomoea triloba]|uniref:uncharacterized protein LOC116013045 n=1 Tax=Ipomoea triloba TaxID=35885 RepID=UPI00125E338B|nr:uncharacterized protein LOC116013045 [Ipomoea triloba]
MDVAWPSYLCGAINLLGKGYHTLDGRVHGLVDCLQLCGERLKRWGGDHFHRFGERIRKLRKTQQSLRGHRDPASLYASARKKKNCLHRLKNDAGDWVEGEAMKPVADNDDLLRPFDTHEVKAALFSMFPDKAPRPDGMNPGFFQHYWDVVGMDVSDFILNCLNTCSFPAGLNDTNVVLIPKKSIPECVSDLRPIALCNVVYKVMAKMLANRMKHLLDGMISESQSAFIPGRLITDNILVAAEVGHFLNRKQCGRIGWGALKLDMAKAYDRMEWTFLKRMLQSLGFVVRWINLVMLCVTTFSYNFLINGVSGGQANAQEAEAVRHCLDLYEEMSVQAVNYHKSSVCFSRNTHVEIRDEVVGVLGVTQAPNFGKYLGLPAFVGRNKRAAFSYIEDKIKQRICSWNKKLLSQADKEVLLKSVAQKGGYTGKLEIVYVCLKPVVAWVSRSSVPLIWQCWENRLGVS